MTPLQFAQQQCSNYNKDGSCSGIGIKDDGSLFSFGSKPVCILTGRTDRCAYFEQCVLPMGFDDASNAGLVKKKDHQEAVALYAARTKGTKKPSMPLCPSCRKREIEPPKRFCYVCSEERKKSSDRKGASERQKRSRLSRKTASKTPVNIGPNEGGKQASA